MKLFTAGSIRALEQRAIDEWQIPADELMRRAASAAFNQALARWPDIQRVWVMAGSGNNGGDGWALANLAQRAGLATVVFYDGDKDSSTPVAANARAAYVAGGGRSCAQLPEPSPSSDTLIVDALLGIGLNRAPAGWLARAIDIINRSAGRVLALDVPSGLHPDTGSAPGAVVKADLTVSFIGLKRGLFTGRAADCTRVRVLETLDLPTALYQHAAADAEALTAGDCLKQLPPRRATAHKGNVGRLWIAGGDHGYAGAAIMAAEAALRSGAGLVTLLTRSAHVAPAIARRPELMVHAIEELADFAKLPPNPDAVVLGPGLSKKGWGLHLAQYIQALGVPMVIDADALNLLAEAPQAMTTPAIITPHPGEAARLLGTDTATIERDRFAAVSQLRVQFNATAVLKGAGTLIADPDSTVPIAVCLHGNAGMASGGMGDVLSGTLGALLAQGMSPDAAARVGVAVHSKAADNLASREGKRGLMATDLIDEIRRLLNPELAT